MKIQSDTKSPMLHKIGDFIFNAGILSGLATLTFGLASCGGGGGGGGSSPPNAGNSTPTIISITPNGMVASSVAQSLSILGTNFTSGMSLSITNSSGVPYTISSSSVSPTNTVLSVMLTINSAPSDNYAKIIVKSSASSSASSTAVFGVAGTDKTIANSVGSIFASKCTSCHIGANPPGQLDLTDISIGEPNGTINVSSSRCISDLRVTAGDPRRNSSVLIDLIRAKNSPVVLSCNATRSSANRQMPPVGVMPILSDVEIQDIIDWVAGGVRP